MLLSDKLKLLDPIRIDPPTKPNKAGNYEVLISFPISLNALMIDYTVFFLARSPDAPKTTMTVLSLSSTVLWIGSQSAAYHSDSEHDH